MLERVSAPSIVASNNPGGTSAVDKTTGVKSDASERGWFSDAAQELLPDKAGTALHYITGYDERLCQKYAAGHVRPSAHFLRVLLRSDHGATWLAAVMDGCTAPWWLERERARHVGEAALRAMQD
jgi:hypothetical protein